MFIRLATVLQVWIQLLYWWRQTALNWNNNDDLKVFIYVAYDFSESDVIYLPVWPDLAKFRHFGYILKVLGDNVSVYLVLGKNLKLLWSTFYAIGQISIVANDVNIKKESSHLVTLEVGTLLLLRTEAN